jgi:hypothetical protein
LVNGLTAFTLSESDSFKFGERYADLVKIFRDGSVGWSHPARQYGMTPAKPVGGPRTTMMSNLSARLITNA